MTNYLHFYTLSTLKFETSDFTKLENAKKTEEKLD